MARTVVVELPDNVLKKFPGARAEEEGGRLRIWEKAASARPAPPGSAKETQVAGFDMNAVRSWWYEGD